MRMPFQQISALLPTTTKMLQLSFRPSHYFCLVILWHYQGGQTATLALPAWWTFGIIMGTKQQPPIAFCSCLSKLYQNLLLLLHRQHQEGQGGTSRSPSRRWVLGTSRKALFTYPKCIIFLNFRSLTHGTRIIIGFDGNRGKAKT